MDNILLFHIGIYKTGSTAIQVFLERNKKKLGQYGWSYPDLKAELPNIPSDHYHRERNGDILGCYWLLQNTRKDEHIITEYLDEIWNKILIHLETKNVIISYECFWSMYSEEFWRYVKKKYDNVKVIVYLRRQDKLIESLWNHRIKERLINKTFEDYLSDYVKGNMEEEMPVWEYKKKLDEIAGVIGKEKLIVRVYEKGQLLGQSNKVEEDFLASIGIGTTISDWVQCDMQNTKLSGNFIEIKRIFNLLLANRNYDSAMYVYNEIKKLTSNFAKQEVTEGYLSVEQRKELLDQFSLDNEQVAKEYFNRDDGILFYDKTIEYPIYQAPQYSSFDKDLAYVFLSMICNQKEELQKLKKQNYLLVKKFLLDKIKSRKLMLFAAGHRCIEFLENMNLPVAIIVDNDEEKCGEIINGIEISYTKSVVSWDMYFVIVTCLVTDEIEQQLQSFGLKKEEDYILAKEYIN